MAKQRAKKADNDPILKELRLIKNLLMLQLLRQGMTSEQVDLAVRMGASEIRRMFPKKKIVRIPKRQVNDGEGEAPRA